MQSIKACYTVPVFGFVVWLAISSKIGSICLSRFDVISLEEFAYYKKHLIYNNSKEMDNLKYYHLCLQMKQ